MKKTNEITEKPDYSFWERIYLKYHVIPQKIALYRRLLRGKKYHCKQEDFEYFGRRIYQLQQVRKSL